MIRSLYLLPLLLLIACSGKDDKSDAYGNFEATEVIVSAESNGKLLRFAVEEGQRIDANTLVALVDTVPLHLQLRQLDATISAVLSKRRDIDTQTEVYDEQLRNLEREEARIKRLLADGAATTKQLEDIQGQMVEVRSRRQAQITSLMDVNAGVAAEVAPLEASIELVRDNIRKCKVMNPLDGTVLSTYAEAGEVVNFGKPLYKIADLDALDLRVYVSGSQLAAVRLGETVEVLIDGADKQLKKLEGRVIWISDQAEFTPKSVQTREERVSLVYAVRVRVDNDGELKIGMPGEVNFQ